MTIETPSTESSERKLRFKIGDIVRVPKGYYREKEEHVKTPSGKEIVYPAQSPEGWIVRDIFHHHRTGKLTISVAREDGGSYSAWQLSLEELEKENP